MFSFGGSREWNEVEDERNDRGVTEEAVTDDEWNAGNDNTYGHAHVEAVPGCWWRPGSRN